MFELKPTGPCFKSGLGTGLSLRLKVTASCRIALWNGSVQALKFDYQLQK